MIDNDLRGLFLPDFCLHWNNKSLLVDFMKKHEDRKTTLGYVSFQKPLVISREMFTLQFCRNIKYNFPPALLAKDCKHISINSYSKLFAENNIKMEIFS